MKHTEQEIIEIAKQVMRVINWGFAKKDIKATFNSREEEIKSIYKNASPEMLKHPNFQDYIDNQKPDYWSVGFDFEPEAEIEYNHIFMDLWDETGEPFAVLHKQAIFKILKDDEGNYYTKLER